MSKQSMRDPAPILEHLYEVGAPYLEPHLWESEHERWKDLLLCHLIAGVGIDAGRARVAIAALDTVGLLEATSLGTPCAADDELRRLLLERLDFPKDENAAIRDALRRLAKLTVEQWDGHIQRFLRAHGERMAEDLAARLAAHGFEKRPAYKTALLWLQRVANIPSLLPDDPHVEAFCRSFGFTHDSLLQEADRRGLNISVLDDLLALEALAQIAVSAEPRPRKRRSPAATVEAA
jgi:hypothetical protein